MEALALRSLAGGALALLLAAGVWMAGKQGRDSATRVAAVVDGRTEQEQVHDDPKAREERDARAYEAAVHEDASQFGLEPPSIASLLEPNLHAIHLQDARVLQAGEGWASPHLEVRAKQDKVTYQQHGATVTAMHLVAEVENVGSVPVAYNVRVRSADRGRCDVRGVRTHNAVALEPGEVASVVVCAGRGALSLEHVEILELSPFGYHLISGLPAHALGIDPITAQAHRPPTAAPSCVGTDVGRLGSELTEGRTRWVDVADFYSRHACTRWQYPPDYRHATERLAHLPITR